MKRSRTLNKVKAFVLPNKRETEEKIANKEFMRVVTLEKHKKKHDDKK